MRASRYNSSVSGFSLIQVTILLAAAAIILASTLPGNEAGDFNTKTAINVDKLDRVEIAMNQFMTIKGRRPCPADGQYDVNDHNFGIETSAGTCTGGQIMGTDSGTGHIVVGTIPTKTLGLSDEYAFDAWGRRFTYVMDNRATSAATCQSLQNSNTSGSLQITIKNHAGATVGTDNIMYAYISHGADGHGAWPPQGSTIANRINRGIPNDLAGGTDSLTNAAVNAAFSTTSAIQTNVRVKRDKTTNFDDLVYYHRDTANTCCVASGCSVAASGGFVAQGSSTEATGTAVAMGDINGDGIDDLIIGAPHATVSGKANAGKVYIIFGNKTFFTSTFTLSTLSASTSQGFEIDGANASDQLGSSLAVGDINGDNIKDIIIGAPGFNTNVGTVYVMFGKNSGWTTPFDISTLNGTTGFRIIGKSGNTGTGTAIATGDINNDGYKDVIMGVPNNDKGYVLFGKGSWSSTFDLNSWTAPADGFTITAASAGDTTGTAVASADINSDGIDDVIISAPTATFGANTEAGKTYVVYGAAGWATATLSLSTVNYTTTGFYWGGVTSTDRSGSSLATADVNGNGVADLMIGAPGTGSAGYVYATYGKNNWSATSNALSGLTAASTGFRMDSTTAQPTTTAAGCSINGSGIASMAIGTPASAGGGKTYILFGAKSSSWSNTMLLSSLNGSTGFSMAFGNLNGVNQCAVAIGAPGANSGAGYVYIVLGQTSWNSTFDLSTLR